MSAASAGAVMRQAMLGVTMPEIVKALRQMQRDMDNLATGKGT